MAEPAPGERIRVPLDLSVRGRLTDAGFTVHSGATSRRVIELFDTGDRRLTAAGAELSFSATAGWIWRRGTLGHPRLALREWAAPAGSSPGLVAGWCRAYRRGRPLGRRATVQVLRRAHEVTGADLTHPVVVTEERIDDGAPGSWTPRLRRVVMVPLEGSPVRRLFDEVGGGEADTLAALRPGLIRAPRLEVPGPTAIAPQDLLTRSLRLSMIQWIHFDCEVSGPGSPDSLRKVRIAARRMRTDLQTFAPLLDPAWVDGLRERLGALTSRLGTVRDAEVLSTRLEQLAAMLTEQDHGLVLPLVDLAGAHLAVLRDEMLAELAGDAYVELLDAMMAAVTAPRWSDDAGSLTSVAPLAARRWRRLRKFVASLGDSPSNEQLHRVRILAKRVRYAVEASIPAAGEPAAACATRIIALQAVLGEQHDAVVTREWLRRHAGEAGGVAFAAGELAALELERERAATARWRGVWDEASRPRDWRWLTA